MHILNRNSLSILAAVSFIEISFPGGVLGMLNDQDNYENTTKIKISEEKNKKVDDKDDFANNFLERLYMFSGKPLQDKDKKDTTLNVYHRDDKVWINHQGKRVLLEFI